LIAEASKIFSWNSTLKSTFLNFQLQDNYKKFNIYKFVEALKNWGNSDSTMRSLASVKELENALKALLKEGEGDRTGDYNQARERIVKLFRKKNVLALINEMKSVINKIELLESKKKELESKKKENENKKFLAEIEMTESGEINSSRNDIYEIRQEVENIAKKLNRIDLQKSPRQKIGFLISLNKHLTLLKSDKYSEILKKDEKLILEMKETGTKLENLYVEKIGELNQTNFNLIKDFSQKNSRDIDNEIKENFNLSKSVLENKEISINSGQIERFKENHSFNSLNYKLVKSIITLNKSLPNKRRTANYRVRAISNELAENLHGDTKKIIDLFSKMITNKEEKLEVFVKAAQQFDDIQQKMKVVHISSRAYLSDNYSNLLEAIINYGKKCNQYLELSKKANLSDPEKKILDEIDQFFCKLTNVKEKDPWEIVEVEE
jgi:hypothetical protein